MVQAGPELEKSDKHAQELEQVLSSLVKNEPLLTKLQQEKTIAVLAQRDWTEEGIEYKEEATLLSDGTVRIERHKGEWITRKDYRFGPNKQGDGFWLFASEGEVHLTPTPLRNELKEQLFAEVTPDNLQLENLQFRKLE